MPPAANYCLTPDQYDLSSNSNFTSSSSLENFPHHHPIPMVNHLSPISLIGCNNNSTSSTSSEDHESHQIKDRKRRRMISNRESARRSRMRKQRQLQELCTQLLWLRDQNHGLLDRINRFLESRKQVLEENDKLKKETLELRKLLGEAQLATTYNGLGDIGFLRDLDHEDDLITPPPCTTAHLRVQLSTTNDSSTLLH